MPFPPEQPEIQCLNPPSGNVANYFQHQNLAIPQIQLHHEHAGTYTPLDSTNVNVDSGSLNEAPVINQ